MAPKSFKNFGKLPLELRLKIWNYSSTPRIVRAKWDNYSDKKYVAVMYVSLIPISYLSFAFSCNFNPWNALPTPPNPFKHTKSSSA